MNERLTQFVEENKNLYDEQIGFRKSKVLFIIYLFFRLLSVNICPNQEGTFYCLFVDLSKAFDRVPHLLLFYELLKLGVHGKFMKVIISMYNKLTACISTPEGLMEFFKCFIGMRKGCMLSPLLFYCT